MAKIQSMTGFGSSEKSSESFQIEIELKSVNNRFLDVQFRMAKNLQPLEAKFRTLIESKATRGTVSCSIQFESRDSGTSNLKINEPLLLQYLDVIKELSQRVGGESRLDLSNLLKTPDLVVMDNTKIELEQLEQEMFPVFEAALQNFISSREKEGDNLVASIKEKIATFKPVIQAITGVLPDRKKEVKEKYTKRIDSLLERETSVSEERIMTEIGLLSERLDIDEELVRF